jgi:glyoxylase-like metal-dependent hydrolase (beta-lactamase superfamily II)/8-oxo-dGTP pyrophosphatase MutT (NUDIX family)
VTVAPVEPKLAATVVLVRSDRRAPEVLLTRRPASMAFAPDMHVFPGGGVDPADAEPSLLARSVVGAADAARALGGDLAPTLALATHVAAIRELFEEAGVLLADLAGDADEGRGRDGAIVPPRSLGLARSALIGGETTFVAVAAELGLRLRTDLLVPLSRWVTPPTLPRRFDARFYAAELPPRARVSFEGDEVAGHRWSTPAAALRAMADGEIGMWVPTSATLQQLEHAGSIDEMRRRITPGPLGAVEVETVGADVVRIVMPAGGGVAGQAVCAYLVGRHRHVLVDPGDPTGPALERAIALADERGGSIGAIVLTQGDPDHAGGAEATAEMVEAPVLGGPGIGRRVPYEVRELADLEWLDAGDVPIRAVHSPGPSADHLAYLVGDADGPRFVIAGDLDGRRGTRAITAPTNETAVARSRDRLDRLAPGATWLSGHPAPIDAS